MPKIDESRIVAYDRTSEEYANGWRYHITVLCDTPDGFHKGQIVRAVGKKGARKKLRYITAQEQAAGSLREDAAADGFKTRGCHVTE